MWNRYLLEKKHKHAMRWHKLTLQAMWRNLLPQLLEYMEEHDIPLYDEIKKLTGETVEDFITMKGQVISEFMINKPKYNFTGEATWK